jgi:hypothetical protein
MALKELRVAEEQLSYRSGNKTAITTTINTIKSVLQNDGRVATAWLLGLWREEKQDPIATWIL